MPRARHEYLLRQLELHGSVVAADVAAELGVAQVTIRRDIVELEEAGLLARVHGGALQLPKAAAKPAAARTLVGVVVPSASSHFPEVIRGMESVSTGLRMRIALGVSQYRQDVERERVARLLELGVQGLVVTPTLTLDDEVEVAQWLESLPVPVVVLERRGQDSRLVRHLDNARTDLVHGTVLAIEHLVELGHKSVGLAVYDRTPTARSLHIGYDDAIARLGLDQAPVRSLPKGEDDPMELMDVLERFLADCLGMGVRAALVHTDHHAARMVEVAHKQRLRVPEDFAIVAYDDEVAEFADVPLTTVTPPRRALGREALRMLAERLRPASEDQRPTLHLRLLPRLTIRESCGAKRVAVRM
nr:LacI family DNA-binding transcriptional regulator [Phytoactinopolyspora mesophila]